MDTGQTALVHGSTPDVMAVASASGQENEELNSYSSSSPTTPNPMPTTTTTNGVDGADKDNTERFDGKIVYNPDGSVYIMEEKEAGRWQRAGQLSSHVA